MSNKLQGTYRNVFCASCVAECQQTEGRFFKLVTNSAGVIVADEPLEIFICEFCLLDENEPIPYTVTSKGLKVGMEANGGGS